MMSIGDKIRTARKEKGITQSELGNLCGMSDVQISQYESGAKNPKIVTLKKISLALDRKLDYFVDVEEDEDSISQKLFGASFKQIKEYADLFDMSIPEFLATMVAQGTVTGISNILGKEPKMLNEDFAELKRITDEDNKKKAD